MLLVACGAAENPVSENGSESAVPDNEMTAAVETPSGVADAETAPGAVDAEALPGENDDRPVVYFTSDISSEGLIAVYEALGRPAAGENVAVKISTGEGDAQNNYLRPELIGDFVQSIDGTIVECNTAVGGRRSGTAMHYQIAEDHGFTAIAPVVIMDEYDDMELPVTDGRHL